MLGCGLLVVFLSACGTPGLPLGEVSEVPMALVYWEGPAARQRADLMREMAGRKTEGRRRGMASLDAMVRLVDPSGSQRVSEKLALIPGRIVLLNARTLERTRFSAAPPNARPLAWSKDHTRLIFNSDHLEAGRSQIFEYDLETEALRKLTRGPALHLEGDYGPGNAFLLTWVDPRGGSEAIGMDLRSPNGGDLGAVVEGFYPSGPSWSETNRLVSYVEADDRGGPRDGSVVSVVGIEPGDRSRRLTRGRDAVFSPDGEWIVFSSQGPRGWRLQRMRSDGSGRSALGDSVLSARWPAISPDGQHVAYISSDDGIDRLYLRRMDGTGDRILLEDGAVAFPVW